MRFFNFGGGDKASKQPNVVNRISDYMFGFSGNNSAVAPALTNETALETAAVLAAVKVISQDIAKTPLRLVEEYSDGDLIRNRELRNHWAVRLLSVKPNSWQTPMEFMETMMINALLGKGALAIKVMNYNKTEVLELLPVPAGIWTAETMNDFSVQYRINFSDGTQRVYLQDEVLFFRGISLNGYTSVSMIEKARQAIGLSTSMENQQLQLAASGGNPSGVLTVEAAIDAVQKAKIKAAWDLAYGANGTGGVAILDSAAKFESVSMSMADSQFIENRKHQIEEVARVFNIQPLFLGHNAGINVDGVDAAIRFHFKNCLTPWFTRIEQALRRDILGNKPNIKFDFDDRELLRGDLKAQSEAYTKLLGSGGSQAIISLNEARYEFGYDPINEDWAKVPSKGGYANVAGMDKIEEGVKLIKGE